MLDPYVYPNSNILINKLNIQDDLILGDFESFFIFSAINNGISLGRFDLSHLRSIHKELFQELYDWAGEIRTVDITKGDSTFCRSNYIENEADKLLKNLAIKDEYLTKYHDKDKFIQKFADYYCEINVIHPFREGNGRTTRIFFEQLAKHNGYVLDFSSISQSEWIEASIMGFNCNNSSLENILSKALQSIELSHNITEFKYILKDSATTDQVYINNNADVLKYFEQYDTEQRINKWREVGKIETKNTFHFLGEENPERLASVLNNEFNTSITVNSLFEPSKNEFELDIIHSEMEM